MATAINDVLFHSKDEVSSAWQRLRSVPMAFSQAGARTQLGQMLKITHSETVELMIRKALGETLAGFKSRVLDASATAAKALPIFLGLAAPAEVMAGVDTKLLRSGANEQIAKGLLGMTELAQNLPMLELLKESRTLLNADTSRIPTLALFIEMVMGLIAGGGGMTSVQPLQLYEETCKKVLASRILEVDGSKFIPPGFQPGTSTDVLIPQTKDENSEEFKLALRVASAFLACLYPNMTSAEHEFFVDRVMNLPGGLVTRELTMRGHLTPDLSHVASTIVVGPTAVMLSALTHSRTTVPQCSNEIKSLLKVTAGPAKRP
eukprot:5576179-Amphidinium_carterae.1